MFKFILLILMTFSPSVYAHFCDNNLDSFPTLSQGRVKPYMVMASESIRLITGKGSYNDEAPSKTFCHLSLEALGEKSGIDLPVHVDHVKLKELLHFKEHQMSLPASEAMTYKDLIRSEIVKEKRTTSYKKALNKLWFKIDTVEKIMAGEFWQVLDLSQTDQIKWIPMASGLQNLNDTQKLDYLKAGQKQYDTLKNTRYQVEVILTKSHIFSWAMLLALLGIFVTVIVKNSKAGMIIAWLTVATEIAGITLRVLVSGRAPITNMYETVLFSGFGALVISLIIFAFKKDKIFILGGLGYNILCLFMMKFAHGMLDSAISPLVPVLRDNFWLSTHVTTIMLSYAALALSWLLANITLAKQRLQGLSNKDYRYYEDLIYTSIKVGVVLLAAGIILGGVWADYSWGRFWGWDPKETWSLIVLLFYMAVLHGKSTSWINTHRFIMLSAAGFMTVMMAWFGVNYILATGLHSYGFSEGGALFLGTFFLVQIVFLIITGKHKEHHPQGHQGHA